MKIILIENVTNLGNIGEAKEVKDGFALNYLIPKKKAVLPNDPKAKEVLDQKIKKTQNEKITQENVKELAQDIDGTNIIFEAKASEKGHLFGSIGPKEIAAKLKINERLIKEHFKQIGTYPLEVDFGNNIIAKLQIEIKKKK